MCQKQKARSLEAGCITKFFTSGGQAETVVAGGILVGPAFPEIFSFAERFDAAQGQDVFSTGLRPEHAGFLEDGIGIGGEGSWAGVAHQEKI